MADQSSHETFSGPFTLGPDFPTPSIEQWRETAVASLKGRPVESLTKVIDDGVELKVLYTTHDRSPDPGPPGSFPFTRGNTPPGRSPHAWEACSLFSTPDIDAAAREIAGEIDRGAQSVWIRVADTVRCGTDQPVNSTRANGGIRVDSVDGFHRLFDGIDLATTPVHLEAGGNTVAVAAALIASARRRGIAFDVLTGSLNLDPLASLVDDGTLILGLDRSIDLMNPLARWCLENAPGLRALSISTLPFNAAGATAVQELAFALAGGIDTLRALEQRGLEPHDACRQIRFIFATARDLFADAAKLRAFRSIWSQAVAACGVHGPEAGAVIHAVSSSRNLTIRDPWVNPLRTTVGAFAAIVGGADAITVLPFDTLIGPSDALARRMAINTQTILREECHLDHVVDPGGGSWFIEQLTSDLAAAAWSLFRDIERRGGMRQMVSENGLAEILAPTAEKIRKAVATRKRPVTGVSTWPNLKETKRARNADDMAPETNSHDDREANLSSDTRALLERLGDHASSASPDGALIDVAIDAAFQGATVMQLAEALRHGTRPSRTIPLPRHRDAAPFEELRDLSDAILKKHGARPRMFLANLGPIAEHTARATFAKNFFEAGGIETVDVGGFKDHDSLVRAFQSSAAENVCICSSDALYLEGAEKIAQVLQRAGATTICLAGRPGDNEECWRTAGIDQFIFIGCDALGILQSLVRSTGAAS